MVARYKTGEEPQVGDLVKSRHGFAGEVVTIEDWILCRKDRASIWYQPKECDLVSRADNTSTDYRAKYESELRRSVAMEKRIQKLVAENQRRQGDLQAAKGVARMFCAEREEARRELEALRTERPEPKHKPAPSSWRPAARGESEDV